ncbi:MAG: hypothetical protein M0P71_13170 [Melioribacteraceae bacterium]|jgi:hypothetical protein|nr:hypothetical protein [Melioribacteraceae bacterium]
MKKCFKCEEIKPLSEFYRCHTMRDGHFNKCKKCSAVQSKEYYNKRKLDKEWVRKERLRHNEKYKRLKYRNKWHDKEKAMKAVNLNNERFPEKYNARNGSKIIKSPEGMVKHHWSYKSEHYKDLIFLTPDNHVIAHRNIIYDNERYQYRTTDGILLDTKISHLEYIEKFYNHKI